MWYEDALCDDGCSTVAYYSDEYETNDVEIYEEVANDVFVDGAIEQARKCFALERKREGKRHTKPFHSVQFVYYISHLLELYQLFLGCIL